MSGLVATITPGRGLAAINGPLIVMLGEDRADLRDALWESMIGGSVDDVLDVVIEGRKILVGTFVVALREGEDLRVFYRGDVSIEVCRGELVEHFDSGEIRTWAERVVSDCSSITVRLLGSAQEASERREHRVVAGMVDASGLTVSSSPAHVVADALPVVVGDAVEETSVPEAGVAPSTPAPVSGPAVGDVDEPPEDSDQTFEQPSDAAFTSSGELETTTPEPIEKLAAADDLEAEAIDASHDATVSVDPVDESSDDSYADMFGQTRHRTVSGAAVDDPDATALIAAVPESADSPSSAPGVATPQDAGDHDGHTLSVAEVRRLREADSGLTLPPIDAPAPGATTVQARFCTDRHPNPSYDAVCRSCGNPLDGVPEVIDRPPLGRMRFSTGDDVVLDRPLLIGRKPDASGRRFSEIPRELRLDVGDGLSRSHALVHLEGWQVRIEDLGSTNHTTVTLPGRQPQRLREGEPLLIIDGTVVDLGGEVECEFDAVI